MNSDSVRFHDVIFILVLLRNGSNTCTNSIPKPLESVSSADCIILVFAVFSETVQFLKCYFIMYMFGSAHITMVRKTMKGNICFVLEFCLLHIVAKMVRLSEHAVLVMNLHFIKWNAPYGAKCCCSACLFCIHFLHFSFSWYWMMVGKVLSRLI